MARRRSPSPPAPVKRMKTAKAVVSDDPAPCISPDVFDHSNIARLHTAYNSSSPFKYALVDRLFQDELLKSVKEECLGELSFTEKETDIYKVRRLIYFLKFCSASSRSTRPVTWHHSTISPKPKYRFFPISSPSGMHYIRLLFVLSCAL